MSSRSLTSVISTQEDYFKSDEEYEEWRKTMHNTTPRGECIWPVEESPVEPLVCVDHPADATIRFEKKLYYLLGHRDCPHGDVSEESEIDNDGYSCENDPDDATFCMRPPMTTGQKIRYCKGKGLFGHGLVKLTGIERINKPTNPYRVTVEDVVIRFVSQSASFALDEDSDGH
jgi:hypothetical protein